MKKQIWGVLPFFLSSIFTINSQNLIATYAGGWANDAFYDIIQLSNGHFLVAGSTETLDWAPATTSILAFQNPGIANNAGSGKIAFLAELSADLQTMLAIYHLPAGAAENFRYIKTTNLPGDPTGEIYISGDTEDTQNGGYFIGKLNGNFVTSPPTGFSWVENVKAATGQYPDIYQPWDVGNDGKVVYAYGDSHAYNWSAVYRLDAEGIDDVVPAWRVHWLVAGGEYYGDANDHPGGIEALAYSAIVFKRDANRCELRSAESEDYQLWQPDGNGGMKKGKWPLDILYDGPCTPGVPGNNTNGPGYTGYSPGATFTYGPSSICIDRRTNHLYIGFNAKSVLPDGQPDFEPVVMSMDANGALRWWSRLYHEVRPDGSYHVSEPDQYVDALAMDYSTQEGRLVVGARCHGNNTENLWEGNEIAGNPGANGFQNRFTGSNGNIHISWLGKLDCANGALVNSTYMAEYAEGGQSWGAPHPDPNLDGWPDPNGGWPDVNTTYLAKNAIKSTSDGSVAVLGVGRRTITTANAFQKMVKPGHGGQSCWNAFTRVYSPSLEKPLYSSLFVGQWDTLTQTGGDNVTLYGLWKTAKGIVVVGKHKGSGAEIPLANVPDWGGGNYQGESAVLAHFTADNITNTNDGPAGTTAVWHRQPSVYLNVAPNPAQHLFEIEWSAATGEQDAELSAYNQLQQVVYREKSCCNRLQVSCQDWPPGVYYLVLQTGNTTVSKKLLVVK
ncbi:MAG: T9SS type A sorting domain-containing protein [Saprospiraceae bacterium]|nr:T9SS type A sorting domain-containing protein [Saprospiraceae bacterium]